MYIIAKDLIQRLLTLDPKERITMEEAMKHRWLQDDEMKQKVEKLMDEEANNLPNDMPPPVLPVCYLLTHHVGSICSYAVLHCLINISASISIRS